MPVVPPAPNKNEQMARWTLVALLTLLAYGSFFPFHFSHRSISNMPRAFLSTIPLITTRLLTRDSVLNVLVYLPVGVVGYFALGHSIRRATMLAGIFSLCVEIGQFFDAHRVTSTLDVLANAGGALVGAVGAAVVSVHWRWPLAPSFLLTCFGLWQLLAFTPIKQGPGPWTMPIEWLAAAWICAAIFGFRPSRPWRAVAAFALTGLVVAAELWPFAWSREASPFLWVPFGAFFEVNESFGFLTILNKTFLYGAAVWACMEWTGRRRESGLFIAGLLFVLEIAQTHIPGRTAEITDAVLALVLSMTALALDDERRPQPASPLMARSASFR